MGLGGTGERPFGRYLNVTVYNIGATRDSAAPAHGHTHSTHASLATVQLRDCPPWTPRSAGRDTSQSHARSGARRARTHNLSRPAEEALVFGPVCGHVFSTVGAGRAQLGHTWHPPGPRLARARRPVGPYGPARRALVEAWRRPVVHAWRGRAALLPRAKPAPPTAARVLAQVPRVRVRASARVGFRVWARVRVGVSPCVGTTRRRHRGRGSNCVG